MKRLIKENSKFIIVMSIVIILGIIGITYALKVAAFNPIGLNTTTGTINANITYDGDNISTITNTDKMLPISDTLVDINTTDERVLKVSFNITGVNTNPDNTIYDISLRDINMDKELKSLYVKWRLYKNNTLLSEGNFSPSFDVKENNRLVLTEVQQDLTTNTDKYVYLMWISEVCTGDITTCDSTLNQNKYSNKTFNASIKIEASTKTKKELVRTKAVIGDIYEDGRITNRDATLMNNFLLGELSLTKQQPFNADVNADGKINEIDYLLLKRFILKAYYQNTLPTEPITDYVFYGDVNEDGSITTLDAQRVYESLNSNKSLTKQQFKNADVNVDGKVNEIDIILITRFLPGTHYEKTLPDYPIIDYIMYGDINEDGEITEEDTTLLYSYLDTGIRKSDQALKNSDINEDGKVDIIDLGLLQMYVDDSDNLEKYFRRGYSLPSKPITKEYYTIQYGDVNGDGTRNASDLSALASHIEKTKLLTGQLLLNADINGDGIIDEEDKTIFTKYIGKLLKCNFPTSPCKG